MKFQRVDAIGKPRCPDCRSTRFKVRERARSVVCATCGGVYVIADVPALKSVYDGLIKKKRDDSIAVEREKRR